MQAAKSKDGTTIAYERSGTGTPLVLIHGTTADHTRWARILPALEQHFMVCAVDRRGRGASGDAETYSIDREYEDVAAVVDSIGEPVFLLGHSYGALCALEAAVQTSDIRKLVLYEPGFTVGEPLYPAGSREKLQRLQAEGDMEGLLESLFVDVAGVPLEDVEMMRREPLWQTRLALAHTIERELADGDYEFEPHRFRNLATPTLLLIGSESPRSLQTASEAIASVLPNSKVVVMQGQGHVAMNTAPELFVREVITFLLEAAQ